MPLPTPNKGEEQSHFISRCISFERKANPSQPVDRVQAMCYTTWRNRGVKQDKGDSKVDPKIKDVLNMTLVDLKVSKIDKENSIIKGIAILSAKAYDREDRVFRIFTDRALNDAVKVFEGALARIDHDRENASTIEPRGVGAGYGIYQNIRRENGKVFGDLHLWDCESARKVMSIAERTPNAVGNSIHAGAIIHEDDDGVEIVEQLVPRTAYGFKPSIDLVEDPAATVGLYQNKKAKSKENDMEFKDLTMELVKTNRPDLEKIFFDEGAKSRDEEVQKLIQERDAATAKCDELEVKQTRAKQDILVEKLLVGSSLPDYAKTDLFRKQLVGVTESKDGDKVISVEDGIKALIQDRIDALEPGGVHDNTEKDVKQDKEKGKVKDEEFVEAFGSNSDTF